jgi:hypothetical protein
MARFALDSFPLNPIIVVPANPTFAPPRPTRPARQPPPPLPDRTFPPPARDAAIDDAIGSRDIAGMPRLATIPPGHVPGPFGVVHRGQCGSS